MNLFNICFFFDFLPFNYTLCQLMPIKLTKLYKLVFSVNTHEFLPAKHMSFCLLAVVTQYFSRISSSFSLTLNNMQSKKLDHPNVNQNPDNKMSKPTIKFVVFKLLFSRFIALLSNRFFFFALNTASNKENKTHRKSM